MTRAPRTTRASPAGTGLESSSVMRTGSMRDAIHCRTLSVTGADDAPAEAGCTWIGSTMVASRSVSRITRIARDAGETRGGPCQSREAFVIVVADRLAGDA